MARMIGKAHRALGCGHACDRDCAPDRRAQSGRGNRTRRRYVKELRARDNAAWKREMRR